MIAWNKIVLALVVIGFSLYNTIVYKTAHQGTEAAMSQKAIAGQQLYQKNNCTACHQLYGLGGYLGPDLTNIISTQNKGPEYVKVYLNMGIRSMPKYDFNEDEKDAIVEYLTLVDRTGYFPNKNIEFSALGWVDFKTKKP